MSEQRLWGAPACSIHSGSSTIPDRASYTEDQRNATEHFPSRRARVASGGGRYLFREHTAVRRDGEGIGVGAVSGKQRGW